MSFETVRLKNGATVLVKPIPNATSVSIGIYALAGLLQESDVTNGIAHFLEHMSFKGTAKRTAKQITENVDEMGGVINAHTSKEYTCYYMTVLPHCLDRAMDILFDLYLSSKLSEKDVAMERQVVLEEIAMYEDAPDENIHDLFTGTLWATSSLGKPILGTANTLKKIERAELKKFKENYFHPENVIVSVAGKVSSLPKLLRSIENYLDMPTTDVKPFSTFKEIPQIHPTVCIRQKKTEQVHFCVGGQGVAKDDNDYYPLTLLSTALGGSMSSRLFQEIRENKGWAYSVYSYAACYRDAGLFAVYAGVNKDRFLDSLRVVLEELRVLTEKNVGAKELTRVKEQLKGNLTLSLEKSSSWMGWMARSFIYQGHIQSVKEVIDSVEGVSAADIKRVARNLFGDQRFSLAAIGPFDDKIGKLSDRSFVEFLTKNKLGVA